MSIEFACGGCGRLLIVADEYAGRRAACPQCSTLSVVPTPPTADNVVVAELSDAANLEAANLEAANGANRDLPGDSSGPLDGPAPPIEPRQPVDLVHPSGSSAPPPPPENRTNGEESRRPASPAPSSGANRASAPKANVTSTPTSPPTANPASSGSAPSAAAPATAPTGAPSSSPAPSPAPVRPPLDDRSRWSLRTPEGKCYGPVDRATLEGWVREGRVSADCGVMEAAEGIWRAADQWFPALAPGPSRSPEAVRRAARSGGSGNSPGSTTTPDVAATSGPTSDPAPDRGVLVLTLGIVGLFAQCPVFSVMAWVMGTADLEAMRDGRMDVRGLTSTRWGRILGMAVSLLWLIVAVGVTVWGLIFTVG